jgi:hypothetical protein
VRVRLYLDEDVIPDLARILRARGFDVISAHERGTQELPDDKQLAYASADGRAILTFNFVDYLRLGDEWYEADREHAGIIVSYRQYTRRQIGELARVTTSLLNQVSVEEIRDTVRVLDEFSSLV